MDYAGFFILFFYRIVGSILNQNILEIKMETDEPTKKDLSLAKKIQSVANLVLVSPYIISKVLWLNFDHNNSKDIAVPKISFGYDISTNVENGISLLYWFVDVSHDYERRLFGIKREEFSTGRGGKGKSVEIISPQYLEEKILQENVPAIARATYEIMPKNDDDSPVKYTLLGGLSQIATIMDLKPFPGTVLSSIKENLDDLLLR